MLLCVVVVGRLDCFRFLLPVCLSGPSRVCRCGTAVQVPYCSSLCVCVLQGLLLSLKSETLSSLATQSAPVFEAHRTAVWATAAQFQAVEKTLYVGTPQGMAGVLSVTKEEVLPS